MGGSLREAVVAAYRQMEGHLSPLRHRRGRARGHSRGEKETPWWWDWETTRISLASGHTCFHGGDPHGPLSRRRGHRCHHEKTRSRSSRSTARPIPCEWTFVDWDEEAAEKGGLRDLHAQGDPRATHRAGGYPSGADRNLTAASIQTHGLETVSGCDQGFFGRCS